MQHERGKKNAYRLLVGQPEGKMLLGGPRHMWVNTIEMDLRVEWCGLDSSGSRYGPAEGYCEHGNEPSGFHEMLGHF
jgi:hypothetical protein